MKITGYAISKKTVSYFLTLILIGGGLWSFQKLGKLEFPSFTVKTAVIGTQYPGASAAQVEQEVTDRIEKAVQQMSQIKEVRSISQTGLSIVYVDIKDYTDFLKRELLLVAGVAGVEIWGDQQEAIYLEISRSRMAELGISMEILVNTLNRQNQLVEAGRVEVDGEHVRINPTGEFLTSLFLVMGISLGLSWVLAITLTPLFCVQFLPRPKNGQSSDPYKGKFFTFYRRFLDFCLRHRLASLATLGALMVAAIVGFGFVENNFFPNDSRNQFMINFWAPEGTHISRTATDLEQMEAYLAEMEGNRRNHDVCRPGGPALRASL